MAARFVFRCGVVLALILSVVCGTAAAQGGTQTPSPPPADQNRSRRGSDVPNQPATPILIRGEVKLKDGRNPPSGVVIERVCANTTQPEGYTNSSGQFSFFVGQQRSIAAMDASVGTDPLAMPGTAPSALRNMPPERALWGCEIRARLSGYTSDSITLVSRSRFDTASIGVIYLYPIAEVRGFTTSATTAKAQKAARTAYEKGTESIKKQKWTEAERYLKAATQAYADYASAWYDLGRVYHQQQRLDEADVAFRQAIRADAEYGEPYSYLAVIAVGRKKWAEAVDFSAKWIRLNPYISPDPYFYSAVANYNLANTDTAEKHAREAALLDTRHRNPKIQYLLGEICLRKGNLGEAAENLRAYLDLAPGSPDSAVVRQQLQAIESREP